jgi:hypothetical protein
MPSPQWWNSAKSAQVSANPDVTVAGGVTGAVITQWLFNDKGSVLLASALSSYYLVVEASADDGQTWVRKGLQVLDERWVEVSITGNTDNTGGAISAQTTSGYVALGSGKSGLISDIPRGCGREISYRIVVPLGASSAGIIWRLVESSLASVLTALEITNVPAGTIAATTVQAALDELGAEKAALAGAAFTGPLALSAGYLDVNGDVNGLLVDSAGLKRYGIVKDSGRNPEHRYLSSIGIKFRRVTSGTVGAPSADASVMELRSDGNVEVSNGLMVGGGTVITKLMVYTPTLSPTIVAANTTAEQTFTVSGLTTADTLSCNKPTAQAGLGIVGLRVSAADTLAITFSNNTGAGITPTASQVYRIVAVRS